jgi:GDP-L-fucose synthase
MIAANLIHAAYRVGVTKLLFLGSSCIYPRECPQPIQEKYLLSGYLEKTNQPYAVAKIMAIELCQAYNRQYGTNFIACMPTNLYGPGDTFDREKSHVIPGLITKFHEAKINHEPTVTVWGSGNPQREFLFVDDLAQALVFLMNNYNESDIINVGTGTDIRIKELAFLIKDVIGFEGDLIFDRSKPDGTPRKLLSVTRLNNLGWFACVTLQQGLERTYEWYKTNYH